MSIFSNLIQAASGRYSDKLKSYNTQLLSWFNVKQFYYCKITNDGHLGFIDSDIAWIEYFGSELAESYPLYCCPEYLGEGVELIKTTQNQFLAECIDKSREKFDFRQWLRFVNKLPDGVEEFGFHSSSDSEAQTSLFINEQPLFRLFMKKFKDENKVMLSSMEESQVNIAEIRGDAFYEKQVPGISENFSRKRILESLGIKLEASLNSRELEVVEKLLDGLSAGQIAAVMNLSRRTIEHYVERIKEKLSCFAKAELIQKTRELDRIGLLRGLCRT